MCRHSWLIDGLHICYRWISRRSQMGLRCVTDGRIWVMGWVTNRSQESRDGLRIGLVWGAGWVTHRPHTSHRMSYSFVIDESVLISVTKWSEISYIWVVEWVTYELRRVTKKLRIGLGCVTYESRDGLLIGLPCISHRMGYTCVIDESQTDHNFVTDVSHTGDKVIWNGSQLVHVWVESYKWVTHWSHLSHEMDHRWLQVVTYEMRTGYRFVTDGSQISHRWIIDGSHNQGCYRWFTYELWYGLQIGYIWIPGLVLDRLRTSHRMGYTYVINESQMDHRFVTDGSRIGYGVVSDGSHLSYICVTKWVTDGSHMSHEMGCRLVTFELQDGLRMAHRWVSVESQTGYI